MVAIPEGRDRGYGLYCEISGAMLELQARDLTPAGVFVPTDDPFEVDREVEVTLHSPIGELNARCLVVQVISRERARAEGRNCGCGMLFIDLESDQRAWVGLTLAAMARAEATAQLGERDRQRAERETRRSRPPHSGNPPAVPHPRTGLAQGADSTRRSLPPPTVRRPPRPNAPDRPQTLAQLELELAALQGRSPWQVLGLKEDADANAARLAFLAMSKRYHPHAYARLDSHEINRVATELFIAHKRAYGALCALLRPNVEVAMPAPAPGTTLIVSAAPSATGAGVTRRLTSMRPGANECAVPEGNAHGAVSIAANGSGQTSVAAFAEPQSAPRAPRSRKDTSPARPHGRKRGADADLAFGSAMKLLAASRFEEAAAEFERVCDLDPEREDAKIWLHVCRARELMADGQEDEARDAYRVVLNLDPAHREALSQVGDVGDEKKRPGLISRWFGSEDD